MLKNKRVKIIYKPLRLAKKENRMISSFSLSAFLSLVSANRSTNFRLTLRNLLKLIRIHVCLAREKKSLTFILAFLFILVTFVQAIRFTIADETHVNTFTASTFELTFRAFSH